HQPFEVLHQPQRALHVGGRPAGLLRRPQVVHLPPGRVPLALQLRQHPLDPPPVGRVLRQGQVPLRQLHPLPARLPPPPAGPSPPAAAGARRARAPPPRPLPPGGGAARGGAPRPPPFHRRLREQPPRRGQHLGRAGQPRRAGAVPLAGRPVHLPVHVDPAPLAL